jgi:hypothetical protein
MHPEHPKRSHEHVWERERSKKGEGKAACRALESLVQQCISRNVSGDAKQSRGSAQLARYVRPLFLQVDSKVKS